MFEVNEIEWVRLFSWTCDFNRTTIAHIGMYDPI